MTGTLALVFDDGFAEDYSLVAPVLDRFDVPATLAVVPGWLGGEGHLTEEELTELAESGWEVAAHGTGHRYLQTRRLDADAAPGDGGVWVSDHVFPGEDHAARSGDGFEITDGERSERHVLCEATGGESGSRLAFEGELDGAFAAGETVVRPDEATRREEIEGSKGALEAMGYAVDTFVFPYDAASVRAWERASGAYDAISNAGVGPIPNPDNGTKTDLRRCYLQTSHRTRPEIDDYLDCVSAGRSGVLAGHSAWESVTAERLEYVCRGAEERGIEIRTVRNL